MTEGSRRYGIASRKEGAARATVLGRWALPWLVILVVLVVWQAVVAIGHVPDFVLPSPTAVLHSIWYNQSELWSDTLTTGGETLAGLAISVAIAVPIAVGFSYSRLLETAVYPLVVASQAVPKLAIAPLFILWFGVGFQSKLLIAMLIAFFPTLVNTVAGLATVPPESVYLVRSMGASEWQIFVHVRMPYALPSFFAGVKVASTLAVIGALIGEFVGATSGLGYTLLEANANLQLDLVFACIVLLSVLGIALFYAIVLLERLVVPWASQRAEASR
ncbi:MAG TPA: ABC transporter permease [Candidatus Dormibacteraeota bacterium]|nr:ABC transporter permease [Candidatus Dormibacteraeota bacterium]